MISFKAVQGNETLSKYVKEYHTDKKSYRLNLDEKEICDLYKEGYSALYISKKIGVSRNAIIRRLLKNNIKLRNPRESTNSAYKIGTRKPIIPSEETKKKLSELRKGENNSMWKGDDVGYSSLHEWIKNHKPKSSLCDCCKENPPHDLANISGEYKRDVNDFEWLCRKCHMTKDGRMKNLKQYHTGKLCCPRCNSEEVFSISAEDKECQKVTCKHRFKIQVKQ